MGLDEGSSSMNMGRTAVTYIDTPESDTSLESAEELRTAMLDRETRKRRADSRKALARPCSGISSSIGL